MSSPVDWVTIDKLSELTGFSKDAIRALKKKGQWREKLHYRKTPNGRLVFSLKGYQNWAESGERK